MWWSLVKFREAKATETMQSRETSLGNVWNAGNLSTILPGWTRPDWRLKVWSEDCPLNNSTTPYYFSMYITYISSWWFQASWKILVKLSPLKLSGYLGDLCTHGQGASKKSTTPTDLWNHHLDMIYYIHPCILFLQKYIESRNQRQISYIKLNIHISLPSFPEHKKMRVLTSLLAKSARPCVSVESRASAPLPRRWGSRSESMQILVFPKIGKHPKVDGENNGKPYSNGWFGGTTIFRNTHILWYTQIELQRATAMLQRHARSRSQWATCWECFIVRACIHRSLQGLHLLGLVKQERTPNVLEQSHPTCLLRLQKVGKMWEAFLVCHIAAKQSSHESRIITHLQPQCWLSFN